MNGIGMILRSLGTGVAGWSIAVSGNALGHFVAHLLPRFPAAVHIDEILIGGCAGTAYWAIERHNNHVATLRQIVRDHHRRTKAPEQLLMRHDLQVEDIMAITEAICEKHGIK